MKDLISKITPLEESMLCRIYGCFSFKNSLGYQLHAVLMDCLTGLPRSLQCEQFAARIFDVKSETLGA